MPVAHFPTRDSRLATPSSPIDVQNDDSPGGACGGSLGRMPKLAPAWLKHVPQRTIGLKQPRSHVHAIVHRRH
jgi:hypothetical protein